MSAFAVGEVAIGQGFAHITKRNGMECEIINVLAVRSTRLAHSGEITIAPCYGVRWADGTERYVAPHQLRKRRPPASDESAHRQAMLDCIERAKRVSEVPA